MQIAIATQSGKSRSRPVAAADPVFALIDAHRAAEKAEQECNTALSRLEEALPSEQRTWDWGAHTSKPPKNCADSPEWIAAQFALRDAYKAHYTTLVATLRCRPTTVAGLAALLAFMGGTEYDAPQGGLNVTRLTGAFQNNGAASWNAAWDFLPRISEALLKLQGDR